MGYDAGGGSLRVMPLGKWGRLVPREVKRLVEQIDGLRNRAVNFHCHGFPSVEAFRPSVQVVGNDEGDVVEQIHAIVCHDVLRLLAIGAELEVVVCADDHLFQMFAVVVEREEKLATNVLSNGLVRNRELTVNQRVGLRGMANVENTGVPAVPVILPSVSNR